MGKAGRAGHTALVVIAGAMALSVSSSVVLAQRAHPTVGRATPTPPAPPRYPGVDPSWYYVPPVVAPRSRRHQSPPSAYYVPVAAGEMYASRGGGVTDANGRPLYIAPEPSGPGQFQNDFPAGTPDLRGTPYVVGEGGVMVVDFGQGDRLTAPSCAAKESQRTPEGKPRTIFYQPPPGGLILRRGARGLVLGEPPAGVSACYAADGYGHVTLVY